MKSFTADFETCTWLEDETYVWAWALCEIGNTDNIKIGTNIEEFFEECLKEKNPKIYFHNLKFDGSFLLNYLISNGYELVIDPKDIREKITAYTQDNRMNLKRSQEYVSEYTKNSDGTYTVMLKIKEPVLTSSLLELKLKVPNRQAAVEASKRWKDKAPNIYEVIFENLLDA